jgi:type III secretory pathway component EscU
MVSRIIIVAAVIAVMFLWVGPVPNWALIGLVFAVLLPMGIVFSVKRMRLEARLARTFWLALTRK